MIKASFFTLSKRIRPKMKPFCLLTANCVFSPLHQHEKTRTQTVISSASIRLQLRPSPKQLIALLLVWFCMKKKKIKKKKHYPKPGELESHFLQKTHRVLVDSLRTGSPAPTVHPTGDHRQPSTSSFHCVLKFNTGQCTTLFFFNLITQQTHCVLPGVSLLGDAQTVSSPRLSQRYVPLLSSLSWREEKEKRKKKTPKTLKLKCK